MAFRQRIKVPSTTVFASSPAAVIMLVMRQQTALWCCNSCLVLCAVCCVVLKQTRTTAAGSYTCCTPVVSVVKRSRSHACFGCDCNLISNLLGHECQGSNYSCSVIAAGTVGTIKRGATPSTQWMLTDESRAFLVVYCPLSSPPDS